MSFGDTSTTFASSCWALKVNGPNRNQFSPDVPHIRFLKIVFFSSRDPEKTRRIRDLLSPMMTAHKGYPMGSERHASNDALVGGRRKSAEG